jgi:hypothetical protein
MEYENLILFQKGGPMSADPHAGFPVDQLLTEREAACILRLSPRTLADRRYRREPPTFIRLGRCVRYRRTDLDHT